MSYTTTMIATRYDVTFLLRNKGGKDKRALIITIKRSLVKSLKIYQLSTTVLLSSTDRKSDHVK